MAQKHYNEHHAADQQPSPEKMEPPKHTGNKTNDGHHVKMPTPPVIRNIDPPSEEKKK